MFYTQKYDECDRFITENPDVAIGLIKNMMEVKGVKPATMAVLNRSNKPKVTRFFNGEVKSSFPDECRVYARSLGGVLQLQEGSDGTKALAFLPASESFHLLLKRFCDTNDSTERDIIAGYEMPAAIRSYLMETDPDLIVEARERDRSPVVKFFELNPYEIIFRNRYHPRASFGVIISPNADKVVFGAWVDPGTETTAYYRRAVGIIEPNKNGSDACAVKKCDWLDAKYSENHILIEEVDPMKFEKSTMGLIEIAHGLYNRLLYVLSGVDIETPEKNHDALSLTGFEELEFNYDIEPIERGLTESELNRVCEVDESHELFCDDDGRPYVETFRLIPICKETKDKFGNKVTSGINKVTLCPLCAAKLKHAEWSVKEDIIMNLYDKKIDGLREAGMNASRYDVLKWQKMAKNKSNGHDAIGSDYRGITRMVNSIMAYAKLVSGAKGGSGCQND